MKRDNFKKKDLSEYLSKIKGFSNTYSKKISENIINSLTEIIKDGTFNLKNIGTFKIIQKKERIGRNPKTKENYIIKARKSITFKVSKKLLKLINI